MDDGPCVFNGAKKVMFKSYWIVREFWEEGIMLQTGKKGQIKKAKGNLFNPKKKKKHSILVCLID